MILYHQRALSLAKTMAVPSADVAHALNQLTAARGVTLPQSLVEWLCLDPDGRIFHKITHFPHYFVSPAALHIGRYTFDSREVLAAEIIFENQGCFVMAVSLEDGDDPAVWVSEDFNFCADAAPTWTLHSHSFTDCIEAFAWDFDVCEAPDNRERFIDVDDILDSEFHACAGPITFACSAWFRCREFRRLEMNGKRVTLLVK
jgi:hypothetical protein